MNGERKCINNLALSRIRNMRDQRSVSRAIVTHAKIRIADPLLPSPLRIVPGVGFVQGTKIGGLRGYGVIGVCEVGGLCEIEDTGAASFARKRRMGDVFNLQRQGHVAFRVRLHEVVEAEKVVVRALGDASDDE